ncbi:MAG TPA: serine/threonine-protein kinase [Ktedonobacteraceae bacterium]|nr:serine/threonine-protein kinase [Ktedonobacteraceae bacterium]
MENDVLIGQQIGAYSIQSRLGEGGMARVYKAYHARLRREVAIKVILSQIAQQTDFKARFEREAQLVASLQHPNIVAVYDFGDFGNQTYLVMQYVGGGTLRDQLRGGHALDPRQATIYAIQMGKALHHAHLRGIVHRDVKPQNMLVPTNDANQLLLSDFGIAKLYDTRHEPTLVNMAGSASIHDPSLTSVDQIVGTAEYMAPEQVNGAPVDARTDVYALGVVLYQMLSGEVPFHSTTIQGLLFQHVHTAPRPLRELNPYVSDTLAYIVARAMAKAPADRFQSAEEMAQALEAANSNATYQLAPPQPFSPGFPQPAFINTPPYRTSASVTNASGTGFTVPVTGRPARRKVISYIVSGLLVLLLVALLLVKTGILSSFNPNNGTLTTTAKAFTENFQNNDRNWTIGNLNNLTASIANNQYDLQISGAPGGGQTYFPHPEVGTLPDNFTLTVSIEETRPADISGAYGLAFRESQNASGGVSCYALIIHTDGKYQVVKYDPNASNGFTTLGQSNNAFAAIHKGLNQFNTLQVTVTGSTFTFRINGTALPGPITPDTAYTGGQLAVLIAGTNAAFVVQKVALAIQ